MLCVSSLVCVNPLQHALICDRLRLKPVPKYRVTRFRCAENSYFTKCSSNLRP